MTTNKNKTPLLRPLRDFGGTLYIFPSATEDIGLNLNSRATGVALSHYALLNLGESFKPNSISTNSGISTKEYNSGLATDLQNYVMNFETVLMNQPNYNYQEYSTVSERVFWHWIKDKVHAINLIPTSMNEGTYKESDYNNRLVQCFGAIDAGNSLSTEFGIFNETYINIPSSYGAGPVFFKSVEDTYDTNLRTSKQYKQTDEEYKLEGRPLDNVNTLKILDSIDPIYDSGKYYSSNSYYEIVKDIPTIQAILKKEVDDNILISSYDDINIDPLEQFENTQYDITSTIDKAQYNFNAILLYYSIYDQDDTKRAPLAINLFGIIFLDGATKTSTKTFIQPMLKKKSYTKPSATGDQTNYFGNSFSFRVNVKTMSIYDNSDALIQDNTTLSSIASVDFSDVISNLNRAIDIMNTNMQTTAAIQDSYMSILGYYDDQKEKIDDLSTLINAYVKGTKTGIIDTSLLQANYIRPTVENDSNSILFMAKDGSVNNVMTYTDNMIFTKNQYTNLVSLYMPNNSSTYYETYITNVGSEIADVSAKVVSDLLDSIQISPYQINDQNKSVFEEIDYSSIPDELKHLILIENGKTYIDYIRLVPYLLAEVKYLKSLILQ